jgi:hypothetical protein
MRGAIVERLAREFPAITYDVTIKIEHLLLKHASLLPLCCAKPAASFRHEVRWNLDR